MRRDPLDVITSRSAHEIHDYYKGLAHTFALPRDAVVWRYVLDPDRVKDRYYLGISTLEHFKSRAEFWFTCEEVLGYANGTTTATVKAKIREELARRAHLDNQLSLP